MAAYDFDIGVIGGGAAGLTVASGSAQLGAKTVLVEQEDLSSSGDDSVVPETVNRIDSPELFAGLPVEPPAVGTDRLKDAMRLDKKAQSNQLRFVLIQELGDAFVTADYDRDALDAVLSAADR